ncbi:hypothetical protein BX281_0099 [Streptomyces sp. Ag82_O1-15]|nr:hypothetical protein BX281_0099 [Streptomyces sp. Ag82_O1-15]
MHFYAIRAPRRIALTALTKLGDKREAVICDPWSKTMHFLPELPAQTARASAATAAGAAV